MKNLNLIFAWVCLLFISTACNDVEPSISSLPVPTSKPYSINREGYAYFRIPTMVLLTAVQYWHLPRDVAMVLKMKGTSTSC